jgi:probable HAF family extracellular repeat protein
MYVRHTTIALIVSSLSAMSHADVVALQGVDGSASHALDINDNGYVVGYSGHFDSPRATMWDSSGIASFLGEITGSEFSVANAINNSNQVVGYSEDSDNFGFRTATLWDGTRMTDLGADMNAVGSSFATDINEQGSVVGGGAIGPGFAKGFYWNPSDGGQVAGTPYMGGTNRAINNMEIIVGQSFFFGDPDNAMVSAPDGRGGFETQDIAPPGYNYSVATDVNNTGMIVGNTNYSTDGAWQAAIWSVPAPGADAPLPTLLGSLDGLDTSEANAVNDSGLIVGYSWDGTHSGLESRAWAWREGVMYDLNDLLDEHSSFSLLVEATGVNAHGDIVGWGVLHDGSYSAFVIEGFVPAPASFGVLLTAGLIGSRRRRN